MPEPLAPLNMTDKNRNYLLLHFVILLGSFVPTMVSWIEVLDAVKLVFVRTFIALFILSLIVYFNKHRIKIPPKQVRILIFSGFLMAAYWVLFVVSTKLSNASVTLVGIATSPIWVTFILPFFRGGSPDFYQLTTGINAAFGIYLISSNDFDYNTGMMVAIFAAFLGGLLTVINAVFVKKHHHIVVTFYQMIGACLFMTICMPINAFITGDSMRFEGVPLTDFLIAAAMAYLFSILAYSLLISVMKKISAFVVTLSNNLSPVYGILIALVLSNKNEQMNIYFYSGAVIIVASVIALPLVSLFFKQTNTSSPKTDDALKNDRIKSKINTLRKVIEIEEEEKRKQHLS